jgi:PAS domain S-box-containing protein
VVTPRAQKHVVLILAREFASNLATATVIADESGRFVFYNEAAETLLGRSFAEAGELSAEQWTELFAPRTLDAEPLPTEETAIGLALRGRRPSHVRLRFTGLDGAERDIAVTALPLFAHVDELVGVMAIFWDT